MILHATIASLALFSFQAPDQCRHEDSRNVQLAGARSLHVEAGSGELRVEGRSGVDGVRIEARLCASSSELLSDMELETGVESGTARVRTDLPDNLRNDDYARMDLRIVVPEGMAAAIEDGSGAMWLNALGNTRVMDGSGSLEARDLRGSLELEDGSGAVMIENLVGSAVIEDGSGELTLRNVRGTIEIDDGSGGIEIVDARSSVHVDDGSGSIEARGVGGDFTVDDDGSGSIRYSDVAGAIRIPQDKRPRGR